MIVKILMLLSGLFVASMLISILTSGFRNLVNRLREGRSYIPVSGHTLILGWSPSIMSVLPELILANESERSAHVVILSALSKQKMDDEVRTRVADWKTTTIVTRSGDTYNPHDLEMVNIDGADSVIVLTKEASKNPDIEVIKTLMAVANNPLRNKSAYHLVASIRDHKNIAVAKLAGRDEAELIPSIEVVSKITAQTCRQPGLPVVYTEIMGFEDNELCIAAADGLSGVKFSEAIFKYGVKLNPTKTDAITFCEGDLIIVVAEDYLSAPEDARAEPGAAGPDSGPAPVRV